MNGIADLATGVFFLVAVLGLAILIGWGQIVQRLVGMRDLSLPVTAAAGLSGLLFLGGILNWTKLVTPGSIDALAGLGLAAAGFFAWRDPRRYRWRWQAAHALVALALCLVGGFVLIYLTPEQTYNWADDFERYFSYPVRMLQTGTLAGNSLSVTGIDTLGGQAFLQAWVIRYFPLGYLGSLETALALPLCLLLVANPRSG